MTDITTPEAVTGELVQVDPRDDAIRELQAQVEALKSVLPDIPTPAKVDPVLEGIYDPEGFAKAEYIPADCPVLCHGSQDPAVLKLVTVLNWAQGLDLPLDTHVTNELKQAVIQFRRRFNVPDEHIGEPGRDFFIGPNTWAAVSAVNREREKQAATL